MVQLQESHSGICCMKSLREYTYGSQVWIRSLKTLYEIVKITKAKQSNPPKPQPQPWTWPL